MRNCDGLKRFAVTYRSRCVEDLQHALLPIHLHHFPVAVLYRRVILLYEYTLHELHRLQNTTSGVTLIQLQRQLVGPPTPISSQQGNASLSFLVSAPIGEEL